METHSNVTNQIQADKIKKKQMDELQNFMQHINPSKAEENCVYCSLAVDNVLRLGISEKSPVQAVPEDRFPGAFYDKIISRKGKRKPNKQRKTSIKEILRSYVNHPEFNERFLVTSTEERLDLTNDNHVIIEIDYDKKESIEKK